MTSMQVERIRVMTMATKTKSETGIKISKRTLDILKNFSTINSGILVNEGNVLTTLSSTKNILAEAHVDETFPRQFAIWDLNKFLGTVIAVRSEVQGLFGRCKGSIGSASAAPVCAVFG
jgi:hypothetical protein